MRNIIEQFNASTISIDLQEFADALMQGYNDNNRKLYTKEQQNEILGYLKDWSTTKSSHISAITTVL